MTKEEYDTKKERLNWLDMKSEGVFMLKEEYDEMLKLIDELSDFENSLTGKALLSQPEQTNFKCSK